MKTFKFFIISLSAVLFSSCDKETKGEFFGRTEYYTDFLFKKYEPVIMKKTLLFEFNDDAQRLLTGEIAFEVVEKTEDDKFILAKDIVVYKDATVCSDNVLKIKPTEKEIILGIEFTAKACEGNHTLYLREKGQSGLDRIDYLELTDGLVVKKDDIYNPLAKWSLIGFIITIALLAVCFIVSRMINPSTKFSKLYIDYNDGAGEQRINMGSAYKLLCTDKKTKFSVFSKFFVGIVKVEVNDFWTHPVTIKSGMRNKIRISGLGEFEVTPDETVRKEPFTVTNDSGRKATITTA